MEGGTFAWQGVVLDETAAGFFRGRRKDERSGKRGEGEW
jgi:hypothetical protein